jgi:hypothetical protein
MLLDGLTDLFLIFLMLFAVPIYLCGYAYLVYLQTDKGYPIWQIFLGIVVIMILGGEPVHTFVRSFFV